MKKEENIPYTIDDYVKRQKKDKNDKILLIVVIVILIIMLILLGYRVGKIGLLPSDNVKLIKVKDNDGLIAEETELNIFNNTLFSGQKKIAPKSKGSYKFCVENVTRKDITYDIKFLDEMKFPINVKYRLKLNNVYVRGNENEYVGIEDLNVEKIVAIQDSNNIFTLDWYWVDDNLNDTLVGSQEDDEYYKLNLQIEAEEYVKVGED
ncbi:MAG: hypothetical protein IKL55_01705 [Clostridia bacterium]|nr:hypothetical protein [Clostridia bacterium]